jgi:hypothetical protein
LLKSVAKYLCAAVSCLSQKFGIWSLPGAPQSGAVLSATVTSVSGIGRYSMQGFFMTGFALNWDVF